MMLFRAKRWRSTVLTIAGLLMFLGINSCSLLNSLVGSSLKKPSVKVTDVKIAGLSFDGVNLMFDMKVYNPNSMGVRLQGFDYGLFINRNALLEGVNNQGIEIAAREQRSIQLPVNILFGDLYKSVRSIQNQDSSGYQLKCGFTFDVPVLGNIRVPVSKQGQLPLLKLPSLEVEILKIKKMDLTGAELELTTRLKNPNAFSMMLNKFNYQFHINDQNWASGNISQQVEVQQKGSSTIRIPVRLNFLKMGRSVYQLLNGDQQLNYRLTGNADLGTAQALLKPLQFPFNLNGNVNVRR